MSQCSVQKFPLHNFNNELMHIKFPVSSRKLKKIIIINFTSLLQGQTYEKLVILMNVKLACKMIKCNIKQCYISELFTDIY